MSIKLPKKFKKRWVTALRSGEYRQTVRFLYDGVGYCCLGVACKIDGWTRIKGYGYINDKTHGDLPSIIAGNCEENPVVNKLVNLNDNGKSFNYIAYYIDRYL